MKHYLGIVLLVVFSTFTTYGQSEGTKFGSRLSVQSQFGIGSYRDSEDFIDIGIRYFDNSILISLNERFSVGFNYNYIMTNNRFTDEKINFYRVGPLLQWDISPTNSKIRYFLQGLANYGNFVIELDDKLNKRNVYYLGLNFSVDFKIIKRLYASAGAKLIRQLEKGDYGLENYPFIGLSYDVF